jgi:hypothetical protein
MHSRSDLVDVGLIDYAFFFDPGGGTMSRHMLQGLKEIADHLGLQAHSLDARRVLLSWIERESLPARRLAGRWYADATEIEAWWESRRGGSATLRATSHQ